MPFQSPASLALFPLGVKDGSSADVEQPPLANGVHLRWSPAPARGFPWYGYFLLRRPHRKPRPICLRPEINKEVTALLGALPSAPASIGGSLELSDGIFSSDVALMASDVFPAPGSAELDLQDRAYLRFDLRAGRDAHYVRYSVGIHRRDVAPGIRCATFDRSDACLRLNPRKRDDIEFEVFAADGIRAPASRVVPFGDEFALVGGPETLVRLPCESELVRLRVRVVGEPVAIEALDAEGRLQASASVLAGGVQEVELSGTSIRLVRIRARSSRALLLSICYRCARDSDSVPPPMRVRVFAHDQLLAEREVVGAPGSIVTGDFQFDLITSVVLTGGEGALVDLCFERVSALGNKGWEPVPKCPQPLCLPVRNPEYPCGGGLAPDAAASEATALSRIRYGDPDDWSGERFEELHEGLQLLVEQGPFGPPMENIISPPVEGLATPPSNEDAPTLAGVAPLQFLLLGALQPATAQALGLYWVDSEVGPTERFDYMIVADHTKVAGGDVGQLLTWLSAPNLDFDLVDAWVSFDVGLEDPSVVTAPFPLIAYALPGGTVELGGGGLLDASSNVGLVWEIPVGGGGQLEPDAPVLYLVRRASLGLTEPPSPVDVPLHQRLTKEPHLVTEPLLAPGDDPEYPAQWPPFAMMYIDRALEDGWYSYRVTGVDLFGRFSPPTEPATWKQWLPAPEPPTWYYQEGLGDVAVHSHAIRLLDKLGPPLPIGVEAFALDPKDPTLLRDAAYDAWEATLSEAERTSVIGLRVSWSWSYPHMRQAPDTSEFRLYIEPGHPNTQMGKILSVVSDSAHTSLVETSLVASEAVDALTGTVLRSEQTNYHVLGNEAGSPVRPLLKNAGPDHLKTPEAGTNFALTVPIGHALYRNYREAPSWGRRLWVTPVAEKVSERVVVALDANGNPLAGDGATASGVSVTLPATTDLSGVLPFTTHLRLEADAASASGLFRILAVDPVAKTLTLEAAPALLAGSSSWEIGVLIHRYEVFLPAPGDTDRDGAPLVTSAANPIVYASIGVSAADAKASSEDDPARAAERFGDRPGNEGGVSGPVEVFRVHREAPPPPEVPDDSDAVFASRADYNHHSFYTVRWMPQTNVATHVFRAMSESVAERDWVIREARTALSGTAPEHAAYYPGGWTQSRRQAAAGELNGVSELSDYAGLSADSLLVLAQLPGNEGVASGGLVARDWLVRRTRIKLSASDTAFFPPDWTSEAKRSQAAAGLNSISARSDYATRLNDSLRVLAGLPGNEAAFQQVTSSPLPNTGAQTQNRLGPDNAADFPIDSALRAFVASIDGRTSQHYFFRTAFVDTVYNGGPLGLSSPPVYLPDVQPPRAPVFTSVTAGDPASAQPGDRKISLRWASNREPDLAHYRLYRSDAANATSDLRSMELVSEQAVDAGPRPEEVMFLDEDLRGLTTYHYRLVAVDSAGNASVPSSVISARAFDTSMPEIPQLSIAWVEKAGKLRAQLEWTSEHEVMIRRREGDEPWADLGGYRDSGVNLVRDPFSEPSVSYQYRVWVRKYTGALVRSDPITLDAQPNL